MDSDYDVVIVGAGPAGIFCAYELSKDSRLRIALVERGKSISTRNSKEKLYGFGGAGTYSDGKLHLTPALSHETMIDLISKSVYDECLEKVDNVFNEMGVDTEIYPKNQEDINKFVEECQKNNIHLIPRKLRHVGSDKLPKILQKFYDYLISKGVKIITETEVDDIILESNSVKGVKTNIGDIKSGNVVLAPGRYNSKWLHGLAKKYGLRYEYDKIQVGVRVEFPEAILRRYSDAMYEPIFVMYTPSFDDVVRSFCVCPNGEVSTEQYNGFICVNGHSNHSKDSKNSNFALLSEVKLTEPVEDTLAYGVSIAKLATTIGSGKPILQRLADLKSGRRSTWNRINRSYVSPSLKEVTPGDIAMALPHRVVRNLLESLEMLDIILPGINSDHTLLYAPEIKLKSCRIIVNENLETPISGLFVAGDGAGLSGSITGAAVTGLVAGEGVKKKL